MKISRVRVSNFQSLESVDIELGDFTVIGGPSDNGKSAFLRAIQALLTNQSGQEFVSAWADECQVELFLDTGDIIKWRKADTAYYYINDQVYSRLGRDVPPDLHKLLPVMPIEVGGVEVSPNYHDQFDMPFMLAMPAPQRARVLGEMTGANILLRATQEAKKRQAKDKQLQTIRTQDIENITKQLESFRWLVGAKTAQRDAGQWLTLAGQIEADVSHSTRLRDDLADVSARHFEAQRVAAKLEKVPLLEGVLPRMEALSGTIKKAQEITSQLKQVTHQLLVSAKVQQATQDIDRMIQISSTLPAMRSLSYALADNLDQIHFHGVEVEIIEDKIDVLQDKLEDLLLGLEVCPICRQPIEVSNIVKHVMEEA